MTSLEILKTHILAHGQHEQRGDWKGMFWKLDNFATLLMCTCGCDSIGFNIMGKITIQVDEQSAAKILQTIHAQDYLSPSYPLRRLKKQVFELGGTLEGADFTITAEQDGSLTMHGNGRPDRAIDEAYAKEILNSFDALGRALEPLGGVESVDGMLNQLATVLKMEVQPQKTQDVKHFFDTAGKVAKA